VLIRARSARGFSLIELMIALAIVATVLAAGVPSFSNWIQNTQIRNAAEIYRSALVTAQTEALRRNTPVRFQLTSTLDSSCALSTAGANWVINVGDASTNDPSTLCNQAPSESGAHIIKSRAAADGMRNVVVSSNRELVVFNSYGRVINSAGQSTIINLYPKDGACTTGSAYTCMRIVIAASGQVRMCNPAQPAGSPQGC
jgi:type IV fimbrial biogenesis protein FimT